MHWVSNKNLIKSSQSLAADFSRSNLRHCLSANKINWPGNFARQKRGTLFIQELQNAVGKLIYFRLRGDPKEQGGRVIDTGPDYVVVENGSRRVLVQVSAIDYFYAVDTSKSRTQI